MPTWVKVACALAIGLWTASSVGMPVSTTHVITSTILGVGLSKRITAVNWTVAGRILVAFLTYDILSPFLGK